MKEHVSQFSSYLVGVSLPNCLVQFQNLLDKVRAEGLWSLLSVPWATFPQVAHELYDSSK